MKKVKEEKAPLKTNKLVVLDYTTCLEHVYIIDADIFVNAQYIRTLGFNPDNVVYMYGNVQTRNHTGVLLKST